MTPHPCGGKHALSGYCLAARMWGYHCIAAPPLGGISLPDGRRIGPNKPNKPNRPNRVNKTDEMNEPNKANGPNKPNRTDGVNKADGTN